ncbi:MAG TPA: glycosyltransferase [Sphingobium sp.]
MDQPLPSCPVEDDAARLDDLGIGQPGTLIVVAMETLWPPNHGGRVDRWNRWRLLKSLGWRLIFVSWTQDDSHEAPGHKTAMAEIFDHCFFFSNRMSIGSIARRILLLPRHSPHMSARMIPAGQRRRLVAQLAPFGADAVVMDGLYGSGLGVALAADLGVPLYYRSHNIEHLYMAHQAAAARGLKRKIAMRLASLHLERAETEIMRGADWVFDISADDMRFWAGKGVTRASWLPPMVALAPAMEAAPIPWAERPYDIAYLGNLNTPNNVEGLAWFVEQVLPPLQRRRPDVRILLAGSNPSPAMRALVADRSGIDLVANPEDGGAIRAQGRVLVNPILRGSGVNVKSVEMLFTDSPVVTTNIGVQGLDAETRGAFAVADDPSDYAALIDAMLDAGPVARADRQPHRDRFGIVAARGLSDLLRGLIGRAPAQDSAG